MAVIAFCPCHRTLTPPCPSALLFSTLVTCALTVCGTTALMSPRSQFSRKPGWTILRGDLRYETWHYIHSFHQYLSKYWNVSWNVTFPLFQASGAVKLTAKMKRLRGCLGIVAHSKGNPKFDPSPCSVCVDHGNPVLLIPAVEFYRAGGRGPNKAVVRVYIVRHGETQENRDGIIQGQRDTALNEIGLEQARMVGEALKDAKLGIAFSSDLSRAVKV